jgi:hypothetical protein
MRFATMLNENIKTPNGEHWDAPTHLEGPQSLHSNPSFPLGLQSQGRLQTTWSSEEPGVPGVTQSSQVWSDTQAHYSILFPSPSLPNFISCGIHPATPSTTPHPLSWWNPGWTPVTAWSLCFHIHSDAHNAPTSFFEQKGVSEGIGKGQAPAGSVYEPYWGWCTWSMDADVHRWECKEWPNICSALWLVSSGNALCPT